MLLIIKLLHIGFHLLLFPIEKKHCHYSNLTNHSHIGPPVTPISKFNLAKKKLQLNSVFLSLKSQKQFVQFLFIQINIFKFQRNRLLWISEFITRIKLRNWSEQTDPIRIMCVCHDCKKYEIQRYFQVVHPKILISIQKIA